MNAVKNIDALYTELDNLHQNTNIYHILVLYDDHTIADSKVLQGLLQSNDFSFIDISRAFSYICNILHLESYYRIFFINVKDVPHYVYFKTKNFSSISAFVSMSKHIQYYITDFIKMHNVFVNNVPHLFLP
jgi:hypothetical protein